MIQLNLLIILLISKENIKIYYKFIKDKLKIN